MEKCGIETAVILGKQGGTQLQQLHMAGYELPTAVTRTIGGAMDQLGVLGAAPPTDYLGKLFLVLIVILINNPIHQDAPWAPGPGPAWAPSPPRAP